MTTGKCVSTRSSHDVPVLGLVVLEEVLEEVDALLRPHLVDLDEVVGRRQLKVLPLFLHLVGNLSGREFRSVKTWRHNTCVTVHILLLLKDLFWKRIIASTVLLITRGWHNFSDGLL